jgi:anti-anti-sigma factor
VKFQNLSKSIFPSLECEISEITGFSGTLFISLTGNLNPDNSEMLYEVVATHFTGSYDSLIINLQNLDISHEPGIGILTHFKKLCTERQGTFVLINVQPKVYQQLQLLGFIGLLSIAENAEIALKFILNQNNANSDD